jgi:hypothetical protein
LTITEKIRKRIALLIHRRLPPCKEIVQIVSASFDRRLTLRERFVMRVHIWACKPCERYLHQSEFLRTATHGMDDQLKDQVYSGRLSDEARERIKALMKTAAQDVR